QAKIFIRSGAGGPGGELPARDVEDYASFPTRSVRGGLRGGSAKALLECQPYADVAVAEPVLEAARLTGGAIGEEQHEVARAACVGKVIDIKRECSAGAGSVLEEGGRIR